MLAVVPARCEMISAFCNAVAFRGIYMPGKRLGQGGGCLVSCHS